MAQYSNGELGIMAALLAALGAVGRFLIGSVKSRSDLDAKRIDTLTERMDELHANWRADVQALTDEVSASRTEERSCRERVEALSARLKALEETCANCPSKGLAQTFEAAE